MEVPLPHHAKDLKVQQRMKNRRPPIPLAETWLEAAERNRLREKTPHNKWTWGKGPEIGSTDHREDLAEEVVEGGFENAFRARGGLAILLPSRSRETSKSPRPEGSQR